MRALYLILMLSITASLGQMPAPSARSNTGGVSGVVLDERGEPLPGATVYALSEADMRTQYHTETDNKGEFALNGLPDGGAFLSAFKESDGYPYNFYSFFSSPGQNTPVKLKVSSGATVTDVRIKLGKRAARLNLQISTDEGKALQGGATLYFTRPDLPGAYSRGAGASESVLVPPVPFRLTVEAASYKTWHYREDKTDLIILKSGQALDISVHLERLR